MSEVTKGDAVPGLAAGWPHTAPAPSAHPVPSLGVSPVSAAFAAATGEWCAVHAARCTHREGLAGKYSGDLHTNDAVFDAADAHNATIIDTSAQGV